MTPTPSPSAVAEHPGPSWRWALGMRALVVATLLLVVWQSSEHLAHGEEGLVPRSVTLARGDDVLGPWLYWDTKYYVDIAEHGYVPADVEVFEQGGETQIAFFPGYPASVAAVRQTGLDTGTALVLVTLVAGTGLAVALHRWFRSRLTPRAAVLASLAVALFPWAYFLVAAGYPEALFLLLAVTAFSLVEADRPIAAGVLAAAACLTRLIGIGLVVGLALRVAERRQALHFDGWRPRIDWSRFRRSDAGVLLGAGGLGGWMVFCWVRYGDPVAFSTAQRGWSQGFGPRAWFKLGILDQLVNNQDRLFVLRLLLQGVVLIAFALAVPAVWRRFGAGYGAYTAVAVLLPLLGSANFASHGRFALMAFPAFGLLGERLAEQPVRSQRILLGLSAAALVLVASCWGRGYWMA